MLGTMSTSSTSSDMTTAAVRDSIGSAQQEPEFLRPAGVLKRYSFGQSWLYERLASGAIDSIVLRRKGHARGVRLVRVSSINALLSRAAAGEAI